MRGTVGGLYFLCARRLTVASTVGLQTAAVWIVECKRTAFITLSAVRITACRDISFCVDRKLLDDGLSSTGYPRVTEVFRYPCFY